LLIDKKHDVKFVWVKGHASNKENNRCDELAVAASKSKNLITDEVYELICKK
jgi:ribonuclease HI